MKFRLGILAQKKLAGIFGLKKVPKFHAERIGLKWHFGGEMYRALVSLQRVSGVSSQPRKEKKILNSQPHLVLEEIGSKSLVLKMVKEKAKIPRNFLRPSKRENSLPRHR